MRHIKKIIFMLAVCVMTACVTASCGNEDAKNTSKAGDKGLKIVTTIFPEYDWVKEILGDQKENVELTMLLDSGVDLHSYQPTVEDIAKVSECDLFIYVGGESDEWVDDALKESQNADRQTINLLEVLGDKVREEEVIEGMEAEEEEEEEGEEEPEYDEHVWLSLKNAQTLCGEIAACLGKLDTAHAEVYQKNAEAYQKKLSDLDSSYQSVTESADKKTLLFGDRFPFRYLTDDYRLKYYAAFVGCSAETEASFETITFLAKKTDELGLKNILTIENSDGKIAETIISNTKDKNQQIKSLDSLQSTTLEDADKGKTYLSTMEKNLQVLKEVLQ